MIKHPRVLGVIRLSVTRDDSTSPERQRDAINHWVSGPSISGIMVGLAEDLDVSGSIHPTRRPQLGPWLTDRVDEWDVIAVWKLDRLTRRAMHFAELVEWCQKNNKAIVSITEGIDMSTPMGKMFAQIIAAFAEGELDTIRARNLAAAQTRKDKGVWIGGVLPFGYQFTKDEAPGKRLVQDPEYAKLLREIVTKVQNDWSAYRLAVDLNHRQIPTWRDYLRIRNGEKPRGVAWTANAIIKIVTNPTVAGFYTYKDELVEDDEGNPVMIADDPILTRDEWMQMVARFTSEGRRAARATPSRSMLGGVAVCGVCGANMSSAKKTKSMANGDTKNYFYYTCNNQQTGTCLKPSRIPRNKLDSLVNEAISNSIGGLPVFEKMPTNLSSLRTELEAATTRLERLEADYIAGRYDGEGQEESYWKMHKSLSGRVSKLKASVGESGEHRYRETGRTYAEVWTEKDDDQKRLFLQKHGVRVVVFRGVMDGAKESVIIEFPNLEEVAKEVGVRLDGRDSYRFNHQVPVNLAGEPMSVDELRLMIKERTNLVPAQS